MVRLESEYHPEAFTTWLALGQLQGRAEARDAAVKSLKRALELAPERARNLIER